MPAALTYNLIEKRNNWYYHTEPQPFMNQDPCIGQEEKFGVVGVL